jgi:hypothetical protein
VPVVSAIPLVLGSTSALDTVRRGEDSALVFLNLASVPTLAPAPTASPVSLALVTDGTIWD